MKVGIIQSSFIPWRGYFDFISGVDLFIFHDDLQYTKGDWRNRNRIKTPEGIKWVTVPVTYRHTSQLICETEIDYATNWRKKHVNQWKTYYRKSPYINEALALLMEFGGEKIRTISQLNIALIRRICEYLNITTQCELSTKYNLTGQKTDRIINLMKLVGGSTYLSGPSGDVYLDKEAFRDAGIRLEYKSYNYPQYPQLWGEFEGAVSILDLIANCGPESRKYMCCTSPDQVIVP